MGLWCNTVYVNEGSAERVADALDTLVAREGMERVAPPAPRVRAWYEPMQYAGALANDLWACAIFPGAPAWVAVQTAPLELLGEPAAGAAEIRLAELCRTLAVAGFHFDLYDSTGSVLAEVAADGRTLVSGFHPNAPAGDALLWNGQRIDEKNYLSGFRLLPFADLCGLDTSGDDKASIIAARFGGANAQYCDNLVSVDTLICHKPFDAPGGIVRYYQWTGPSRNAVGAPART